MNFHSLWVHLVTLSAHWGKACRLRAEMNMALRRKETERARTESIQHRDNERRSPPFIVTDSHEMSISSAKREVLRLCV